MHDHKYEGDVRRVFHVADVRVSFDVLHPESSNMGETLLKNGGIYALFLPVPIIQLCLTRA